jgi:hypothetical protein
MTRRTGCLLVVLLLPPVLLVLGLAMGWSTLTW